MAESKQDIVVKLVQEGIHTRSAIRKAADCTAGALASYFSGMRNAAKFTGASICPIEIDLDGKKVFTVKTFEEVEEMKAAKAATKPASTSTKTPAERLELAEKRINRCTGALEKSNERAEAAPENREVELRAAKAKIELELAEIELKRVNELIDADEAADDVEPEEDELM